MNFKKMSNAELIHTIDSTYAKMQLLERKKGGTGTTEYLDLEEIWQSGLKEWERRTEQLPEDGYLDESEMPE